MLDLLDLAQHDNGRFTLNN